MRLKVFILLLLLLLITSASTLGQKRSRSRHKQSALQTSRNTKPLTARQRTSAQAAIKALRKISSALEVGLNMQDYSRYVIDAKLKVDEAIDLLPSGKLMSELRQAVIAHINAAEAWRYIQTREWESAKQLNRYFNVMYPDLEKDILLLTILTRKDEYRTHLLNYLWEQAGEHIRLASNLLPS